MSIELAGSEIDREIELVKQNLKKIEEEYRNLTGDGALVGLCKDGLLSVFLQNSNYLEFLEKRRLGPPIGGKSLLAQWRDQQHCHIQTHNEGRDLEVAESDR